MIKKMIGTRGVKLVFLFILLMGVAAPVQARQNFQQDCGQYTIWNEERTGNFSVVYTPESGAFAPGLLSQYSDDLEGLYAQFEQAIGQSPAPPIIIRIYPRDIEYYCLNPFPPELVEGQTHSHISSQEIALLGNIIFVDVFTWQSEALNALGYELAGLFLERVTNGNTQPGILSGIGLYAQNPQETFHSLYAASGSGDSPTIRWRDVWESENQTDPAVAVHSLSITAYLIDVYGWEQYVSFLNALKGTTNYRSALQEVYGLSLSELEDHWRVYFPTFVTQRWQVNVIHNFDLSVYQQLIEGHAYTDAKVGLEEAQRVIAYFEGGDKLITAQSLLAQAEKGIEAGALAGESRQAVLTGDYSRAIATAHQSLDLFAQLGDDSRVDEVTAYLETAQEILDLRAELDELKQKDSLTDPTVLRDLERIGARLAELGDQQGVQDVQEAMQIVSQRERTLSWALAALGVALILFLLLRQVLAFRKQFQEETLL